MHYSRLTTIVPLEALCEALSITNSIALQQFFEMIKGES